MGHCLCRFPVAVAKCLQLSECSEKELILAPRSAAKSRSMAPARVPGCFSSQQKAPGPVGTCERDRTHGQPGSGAAHVHETRKMPILNCDEGPASQHYHNTSHSSAYVWREHPYSNPGSHHSSGCRLRNALPFQHTNSQFILRFADT